MKKILIIILLSLIFSTKTIAETYYFNECNIDGKYIANYSIDFEKNIIKVNFLESDGMLLQEWTDKIESITKDRITSKIIKSKKREHFFTQYYLDVEAKSVFRQGYSKKHTLDVLRPEGTKRQSVCKNVKADWDINKIRDAEINKDLEQIQETQEKISDEKTLITKCEGDDFKKWTKCKGTYSSENGTKYTGYFINGKIRNGNAIYPGGAKYNGKFQNNLPHGQGTFIEKDGTKYVGAWIKGKNFGQGIKTWKDGKKYVGNFENDKPSGKGTFVYSDGSKYTGDFKDGKKHGKGTLTSSDGRMYVGQFIDGEKHGDGTCYKADGSNVPCKMDMSTTGRDIHDILVSWKKWIKISEYDGSTGKAKKALEKLEINFQEKASEICISTGKIKILEKKIIILEMDETPAYGLETVVKMGITGVIECEK